MTEKITKKMLTLLFLLLLIRNDTYMITERYGHLQGQDEGGQPTGRQQAGNVDVGA